MKSIILENLKKLEAQAKSRGESYRARAFKNAYDKIKNVNAEIKRPDQLKGMPGIGKGILERVKEILEKGKLKELEVVDLKQETMERFLKIHGVGVKTADRWYTMGYRDLNDLMTKANLTKAQEIGIRYYDELTQKIPREKIDEINDIIQAVLEDINSKEGTQLIATIAGSYIRGAKECGDIDCLITDCNNKLDQSVIDNFLQNLRNIGLITDDLGIGPSKFIGICVDSNNIHRRIDFEFVKDYASFPYELLYFTGSQQFNVEVRQKAKDMGMVLNQNGLFKNGNSILAKDEKEIFHHLNMKYRKPENR